MGASQSYPRQRIDPEAGQKCLAELIQKAEVRPEREMAGVLRDFEQLIETEPGLKDLADGMFNEVPQNSYYDWDPSHRYARVQGYQHMLRLFNEVLVTAPTWNAGAAAAGMAGAPFNAILAWPMATASGQAFFLNKKVNKAIQKVLKEWGRFLQTEDSAEAIDSWLENVAADDKNPFEQLYLCDPNKPHHGFSSWDAFFTREFRDGVRPLAAPDDGPPFLLPTTDTPVDPTAVIISPCESVTYWRSTSVQARDTFWLKGQPYSLSEMLDHDALASRFTNGTVHQSWVEAESYHRWHAPVSGTIVKTATIRGSYFAQLPAAGFPDPDPTGQNFSLRYLTSVATRSLVFIEADNPDIGLMCFVAVSMMEVSSCEVIVKAGQYVRKGDQIGMFHFGGSTQCLVFRPGVELDWVPEACPPFCGDYCGEPKMILVNSWLACVRKPEMWVDAEGCVVVERAGLAP